MAKWRDLDDVIGLPAGETFEIDVKYASLRRVLDLALAQASGGKGKERHANGLPFDCQPMLEIGRMVGVGFCLGQAMKKAQESSRMQPDAAKRELLGAINYLAGAYLLLEENGPT
jgi:hypothetical protein